MNFETKELSPEYDHAAPDQSYIRVLPALPGGGLAHCTLEAGAVSHAVAHKTVEEIWYFLEGKGEVWRRQGDQEAVVEVHPGVSLTIPLGTHFQFRNTGTDPLRFLIVTVPPWSGADEAYRVEDFWAIK
ncbi:MAG TPA: cupin domain-containing protein [Phototrophicaceae bacterium]|nr:cupin domain-containing protein [Phototrophicaceae bacterium]